jgi:hypothetical protein
MKRLVLTSALSAAAVCAVLAATPAFAQDTVTGAPAGEAPVTVEGYGYAPGQPGFGYNGVYEYGDPSAYGYGYPSAYGYGYTPGNYGYGWGPFAPVGGLAAGLGATGYGTFGPQQGTSTFDRAWNASHESKNFTYETARAVRHHHYAPRYHVAP